MKACKLLVLLLLGYTTTLSAQETYKSRIMDWTISMPEGWKLTIISAPTERKEVKETPPEQNAHPKINPAVVAGSDDNSEQPPEMEELPPQQDLPPEQEELPAPAPAIQEQIMFSSSTSGSLTMVTQDEQSIQYMETEDFYKNVFELFESKLKAYGLTVNHTYSNKQLGKKSFYVYTYDVLKDGQKVAAGEMYCWKHKTTSWVTNIGYTSEDDHQAMVKAFKAATTSF